MESLGPATSFALWLRSSRLSHAEPQPARRALHALFLASLFILSRFVKFNLSLAEVLDFILFGVGPFWSTEVGTFSGGSETHQEAWVSAYGFLGLHQAEYPRKRHRLWQPGTC